MTEENIKPSIKQTHFLFFGSCLCCASYINLSDTVETCPSCMYSKVESMLLSDNEIYTFRYDMMLGVTLRFETNR
jgi:hypothetical protein